MVGGEAATFPGPLIQNSDYNKPPLSISPLKPQATNSAPENSVEKQTFVSCGNATIRSLTWKQGCNAVPEPIRDHKVVPAHDNLHL